MDSTVGQLSPVPRNSNLAISRESQGVINRFVEPFGFGEIFSDE